MKKPTVTIGISAYNEQANIGQLLHRVLQEKPEQVRLEKVIVISDGSTDETAAKVKDYAQSIVRFIDQKKRLGLHQNQNRIVRMADSDILIILDADVLPNKGFIDALCRPILESPQVGIVGARTKPAVPRNALERVIVHGRELKTSIYERINGGDTIYLCHGRARAFAKRLYKRIVWPVDCPEDSYSYLFCLEKGFSFVYEPKADVTFRVPSSFREYAEKHVRFLTGKNQLSKYFEKSTIRDKYRIPLGVLSEKLLESFLRQPFATASYLGVMLISRLIWARGSSYEPLWEVSETSKKILDSSSV